jgi:hypothetical protein
MARYKQYNSDYKDKYLGFPLRDVPDDEKDALYHLGWAKGIYSSWYHKRTVIPYSYQSTIDMLRRYGRAAQPIELYYKDKRPTNRNSTDDTTTDNLSVEWRRDGNTNMDLSIISVAPRVKSMIKSYLTNIKEDIVVDTIDPKSGSEKEAVKWDMMLQSQDKDFIEGYTKQAGLPYQDPTFLPGNTEELEMYEQAGGFKLASASTMEKLVQYTMELSGYEDELENELYNDLMDVGICATKKYLDPEDNKFKDEYVDVKYLVVQNSLHNDFRDIEYAGHVRFYTISKLRQFLPGVPEQEFRNMAYAYLARNGNPGDFRKYNVLSDNGMYGYDTFLVSVFEAQWMDEKHEMGRLLCCPLQKKR